MQRAPDVEQRMTQLLSELQLLVRKPTFSFRLDEIRGILAELAACWDVYRRGGTGVYACRHAPSSIRQVVDFPYTRDELHALFTVAYEEDVEHGGRYDAWSATITLWTHAWPPPWRAQATEDSLPKGSFYVAWGRPPGVWLIEVQEGFTLAELLQELGRLELIGLGYLKHGKRPAAS
jgi:hypothetical protein